MSKLAKITLPIFSSLLFFAFLQGIATHTFEWLQWLMMFFILYGTVILGGFIIKQFEEERVDLKYKPFVSILIPAHNEENVIESTVLDALNQDYRDESGKRLFEVIVIDNVSSDNTPIILKKMQGKHPDLKVVYQGQDAKRGKPAALMAGLRESQGEVIAVFDSDTRIPADFIRRCIPYLSDPKVGGVQSLVRMYNAQKSFLTKAQDDEFAIFTRIYQEGRDFLDGAPTLGGNGQITKKEAILAVGGWNEHALTEDLELSLRLYEAGYNIRFCPEVSVYQEGVENFGALVKQRTRWALGYLQCLMEHTPKIFLSKMAFNKKLDLSLTLFSIFLPYLTLVGYVYLLLEITGIFMFYTTLPSFILNFLAFAFIVNASVGARVLRLPRKSLLYVPLRYWLFSLHWLIAYVQAMWKMWIMWVNDELPFWDKTHHKGLEEETSKGVSTVFQTIK